MTPREEELRREELRAKREKMRAKRKKQLKMRRIRFVCILAVLVLAIVLIRSGIQSSRRKAEEAKIAAQKKSEKIEQLLDTADRLAKGCDYDGAIQTLSSAGKELSQEKKIVSALQQYQKEQSELVPFSDMESVTHVFFHTLIKDPEKAFDNDYTSDGYNQYMTTIDEFEKILEQMYQKGYILIDLYDMVEKDESGKFRPATIMLPPGKIPFVMSQDDVCYYDYMTKDGFASKIVLDDDRMPTCEYVGSDHKVTRGDFDLVPILEHFIEKHPDFSYQNARAVLAVTGYEGLLGYRVSPDDKNYKKEDIEAVKPVIKRLKELGWSFASHSWGHHLYGDNSLSEVKEDANRWQKEIGSILGDTDIIIYAHGQDIAGVEDYDNNNEKFKFLKSLGFDYFCNVDAHRSFVQIRDDYVRQGRRNLDGYRMYYNPEMLDDLFDVDKVFDPARPTPVPAI